MKNWFIKHREVLAYLVFGVLTTLLNIVLYALFSRLFGYEAANSWGNVLDNVICILFAYVTNRAFVFASRTQGREALKEFGAFVTCRLGTLVLDAAIMMIFGNLLAAQGAALVESFMNGALSLLAGWFGPDTVLHMATGGAAPAPSISDGSAAIAIIGGADGPTAIFVANTLGSKYLGAIMVAAYSYMALVPIVQPPVIRLCTTKKERLIRMPYQKGNVSKITKILFPIVVTMLAGLVAPASVALVGFLMFGNLLRECGVLNALSETAQNVLANLITIVLGLTVAGQMTADKFVQPDTLLILALGLVAFIFDTAGGVFFAKLLNLFLPEGKKINPMIGAAGISAFPMSGRVVNQMGLAEDNQNFLLMYSISVNVSGQIASVIAGGLILTLMNGYV